MDAAFFDENGEFIIAPPGDYELYADCTIKWHICTKCYGFNSGNPELLKSHSQNCNPKFNNIIYQENDYSIALISTKSSDDERKICEDLMTVEADENNMTDSVTSQKWRTRKYQVFLLLKKSAIIAVAVTQKGKIRNETGQMETCALVSRIFTLYSQRRNHHMEKLLSIALETLGSNFSTVVFQRQFSKNGEACLTRIAKKQGLKSIRTFCPPWEDRIMPFPIP
ncbi:MAG: hypothetical protein ABSF65_09770 [Candidatus Bathyarchaeia archaeon]|jgi:hypothetical protein